MRLLIGFWLGVPLGHFPSNLSFQRSNLQMSAGPHTPQQLQYYCPREESSHSAMHYCLVKRTPMVRIIAHTGSSALIEEAQGNDAVYVVMPMRL